MAVVAGVLVGAGPATAARTGDSGRFDTWTGYSVGRFAIDVVARDLNGDRLADAVWLRDEFFSPTFSVQLNVGDGTLGDITTFPVTEQPNDIDSGDIDSDGDVDLVVVSDGNSLTNTNIDVYRNDGRGSFVRSSATGGRGPEAVTLADLDGDRDLDMALASDAWDSDAERPGDEISIVPGNGNRTFGAERRVQVGEGLHGIDAADLDGDGDQDLAVTRSTDAGAALHVVRNDGALAMAVQAGMPLGTLGSPIVAAGPIDAGPLTDLVVAGAGDRHLVLRNDGGLSFRSAEYRGGFGSQDLVLTATSTTTPTSTWSAPPRARAAGATSPCSPTPATGH